MLLNSLNDHYEYKYDAKGRDRWRVIKQDSDGMLLGDCEDYALSVLYYVISKGSWLRFWLYLFTFQAQLCGCYTKNGGGHAVLWYRGQYIDNWTKAWVDRNHMEDLGHNFWPWYKAIIPTTVAIKMILAKVDP